MNKLILISALLLSACVGSSFNLSTASPEQVVRKFFELVQKGDYSATANYVVMNDDGQEMLKIFANLRPDEKDYLASSTLKINGETQYSEDKNTATVPILLMHSDQTSVEEKAVLDKTPQGWKMNWAK